MPKKKPVTTIIAPVTDPPGNQTAVLANRFIQHARYRLTSQEQKFVLYLATLVKPDDEMFNTYSIPVKEIEKMLNHSNKKRGAFYNRLDDFLDNLTDKKISFPTDFEADGQRLRGYINWVASAVPYKNERGELHVRCGLSNELRPFLLGLSQRFTKFDMIEVAQMTSGFSIRIFQMCKAYYLENERHGRHQLTVAIQELKERLGIPDKYSSFRDFKKRVLVVAQREINEKTGWRIDFEPIRHGTRQYTHVRFDIRRHGPKAVPSPDVSPTVVTYAKRLAVDALAHFGLSEAEVVRHLFPKLTPHDIEGYEDYFTRRWIDHLLPAEGGDPKLQADHYRRALKTLRSDSPTLLQIVKEVRADIMKLAASDPEKFANRYQAAQISEEAFQRYYHEQLRKRGDGE